MPKYAMTPTVRRQLQAVAGYREYATFAAAQLAQPKVGLRAHGFQCREAVLRRHVRRKRRVFAQAASAATWLYAKELGKRKAAARRRKARK